MIPIVLYLVDSRGEHIASIVPGFRLQRYGPSLGTQRIWVSLFCIKQGGAPFLAMSDPARECTQTLRQPDYTFIPGPTSTLDYALFSPRGDDFGKNVM